MVSDTDNRSRVVRWSQSEGMVDMGVWGFALGITPNGGTIVGQYLNPANKGAAFRYTAGTGIVGLPDLPGGPVGAQASAISDDGQWIAGDGSSDLGREACVWRPDGTVFGLGQLPVGTPLSYATGISNDGRVVIGISGGSQGFVWTAETGMLSVGDMMKRYGYDLKAFGWRIGELTGVSADGQYMCGTGINPDGKTEAVLLYIPIPAPATLTILAAAYGFAARRRARV